MLTTSRTIPAPPDDVWALLVEVDAWPRWGPTVSQVRLDHSGGRIRKGSTGVVVPLIGVPLWAPAYLAVCALALRRLERLVVTGG